MRAVWISIHGQVGQKYEYGKSGKGLGTSKSSKADLASEFWVGKIHLNVNYGSEATIARFEILNVQRAHCIGELKALLPDLVEGAPLRDKQWAVENPAGDWQIWPADYSSVHQLVESTGFASGTDLKVSIQLDELLRRA